MRTLTGTRDEPPADDSQLSRRRTIESAQLVSRTIGIAFSAIYAGGGAGFGPSVLSDAMLLACWAGFGLMAVANVLGFLARRRPGAWWYSRFSTAQVVLDTATILAFVIVSEREFPQSTWPLLGLAITIAALRLRLTGALLVFAVTSVAFALFVPASIDLPFVVGINAMTAVIAGAQASAFDRQLRTLHETRQALQHQATHDGLTGLPNRAQLAAYAERAAGRPLAVLLLDLNGFKQVNDTYGHAAGDRLLHEVGARLTGVLGAEGLAGRLGGDEFLVLLPDAGTAEVARAVVRIRDAVRRPVDLGDGREVTVGVSAGVAIRPAGGDAGLDALSAEADAAMYRDKRSRRAA
ncbi:GGDEF domain-containing protein [Actinoplanes sp. NPDC024001]|uniref:GGDEF domain-containing protein n=1 Tax=Actinoplanes sp. NPDC024001 TaxID=3154598 RepID=UPI0033D492FC